MAEDKASNPHPSYDAQQTKRDVYRAVYGGTDTMRAGNKSYLPMYPAEAGADYSNRLSQATIDGIVTGGVDTLCGSVFEGEIDTSGVKLDQKLLENVDNKGNSFNIFARDAFRESFDGFSAILVDMPNAVAQDAEQERVLGIRPYLNLYCASNVINWRYQVNPVSKQKELVLLVLKEVSEEPKGRFTVENVTRYRVFEWNGSIVSWSLYEEVKGERQQKELGSDLKLVGSGFIEKVKGIPVAFIGDVRADPKLLVESRLEIKAYQKESSLDVIEYLSIPTFYTVGYDGDEPLKLGASAHIKLPAGADASVGYAQIDSKGLGELKATIDGIKNYIRARVNYLVESATVKQGGDKTATQVVSEDEDQKARLVVWADELKDALETALMYMGQFLGMGDDAAGEIVLKTKWAVAAEKQAEADTRELEMHRANVNKTNAAASK